MTKLSSRAVRRALAGTALSALTLVGVVAQAPAAHAAATGYTTADLTVRAGTNTGTAALTSIPAGAAVTLQCQTTGQLVNGTYNSEYWAKVTYGGKTGYVSRAYVRVPDATGLGSCSTTTAARPTVVGGPVTLRVGTSTGTAALASIPDGTALTLTCQVQGQSISGTYNTNWWAKTTYGGQTGYVSRAYVRVPAGVDVPTCAAAPAPAPAPANSVVNGPIRRAEVLSRARYWVNRAVPYSMYNYTNDPQGKSYRTDCSGMVSMALHLDTSLSTVSLPERVYRINKSDLRPGDIVGNLGAGTAGAAGHVMIFNGWTDGSQTSFYTLEETPGYAQAKVRTWGSASYTSAAWRYSKIAD